MDIRINEIRQTAPTGGESVYLFLEFTINPPTPLTMVSPLTRGARGVSPDLSGLSFPSYQRGSGGLISQLRKF